MVPPGTLILDNNLLRRFEDSGLRNKVERSIRVAGLEFQPTAINVFEAVRTSNPNIRHRLLSTLRVLASGASVRPLPSEILALTGRMIADGKSAFTWPDSRFEWMLYEPDRITDAHVVAAGKMLDDEQANFDAMHQAARKRVRTYLKQKGVRDPWGDVPSFLDAQWTTESQLDAFVENAWLTLKLPGVPNIPRVLKEEAWRLYFEGFGATVYERAIMSQTVPPAHAADIRQLTYLAGSFARVIVTDDGGLIRVAKAVLTRRYPNTRVLTLAELVALSSRGHR